MEGEVIAVHDAYSAAVASGVVQCVSLYEAVTAANEIIYLTVETGRNIHNYNINLITETGSDLTSDVIDLITEAFDDVMRSTRSPTTSKTCVMTTTSSPRWWPLLARQRH